jgi:hypothetical protein
MSIIFCRIFESEEGTMKDPPKVYGRVTMGARGQVVIPSQFLQDFEERASVLKKELST